MAVLIIIGVFIFFVAVARIADYFSEKRKSAVGSIQKARRENESERTRLEFMEALNREKDESIEVLSKEKAVGFPWLGTAYADYFHLCDMKIADYLDNKTHPAKRAAELVRESSARRRAAEKLYRIFKYQLEYYEKVFPWLVEFKSEDIDELVIRILEKSTNPELADDENQGDAARSWLTKAEYDSLPSAEKYQLALDRYQQKRKKSWEIGRDYERYVGYLYEKEGSTVHYQGIVEGLHDLGRDLVVTNGNSVEIVQCKCWSQSKMIHEKHIFQLFGTTVEYYLKKGQTTQASQMPLFPELLKSGCVKATFVTSTTVSDVARGFAQVLGVTIRDKFPLEQYPCVKCNISFRSGEKIYHLPFDQQYDRTVITEERNECYVSTVREAEELGFRRAMRWRGNAETERK